MKTSSIVLIAFLSGFFLVPQKTNAQVNVQVNVGIQPPWGPVGYSHVDYYYLPAYDAYYHVPRRQFIYLSGGNWLFGPALPPHFGRVDLYRTHKVVINSPRPYMRHNHYRAKYVKYRGHPGYQRNIRAYHPANRSYYHAGHYNKSYKHSGRKPGKQGGKGHHRGKGGRGRD